MSNPVVAILCSDIHLSHSPPVARSAEPSWYSAMARPLAQIRKLAKECRAPVVCAGDVFDKWNPPPELINFALQELPEMFAIPGQHDLPHHDYGSIRKSAYWTLIEAEAITNLPPGFPVDASINGICPVRLHGFPFGFPLGPLSKERQAEKPARKDLEFLEIAVVHRYVWSNSNGGYSNAPKDGYFREVQKQLAGYDLIVSGDNHIPFSTGFKRDNKSIPPIWNCGGLMRRKSDERNRPCLVGLLHEDGSVTQHELDCSEDKWLDPSEHPQSLAEGDYRDFLEEMKSLGDAAIDFGEAVNRFFDKEKTPSGIRRIVLQAMEEKK